MGIDSTLINIEGNTQNANSVKDIVIRQLEIDGVITEEVALDYSENWHMVIIKLSWFKKLISDKDYYYRFVRFSLGKEK